MAGIKGMKWGKTKKVKAKARGKGQGWHGEPRRHGLSRMGINTVLPDGRRLPVDRFIAMGNKSKWYRDGYNDGRNSAETNLSVEYDDALKHYEEDNIGEYIGELRSIQVQYAGDISYDVKRDEFDESRSITEEQYEDWEDGFYAGFTHEVRIAYIDRETDIYDNGGKSIDRYSIVFKDGDLVGMSDNPKSPQGFNQYSGNIKEWGLKDLNHLGKKVSYSDLEKLPKDVLDAIEDRIRSGLT